MTTVLVILLVTTVMVAAVRLLLGRKALPAARRSYTIIGVVAIVAGTLLAAAAFDRLVERFEQRRWPTATGRVIESTVTGERSFVPQVTYEYMVDGLRFTGASDRNVPLFGNKRRNMEVAMKEAAQFPPGTPVKVYYEPGNPGRSTILPEPRWNDLAQSGLGVFVFAAGLFLVLLPRAAKPK